jgi:hypothetical protein
VTLLDRAVWCRSLLSVGGSRFLEPLTRGSVAHSVGRGDRAAWCRSIKQCGVALCSLWVARDFVSRWLANLWRTLLGGGIERRDVARSSSVVSLFALCGSGSRFYEPLARGSVARPS